MFHKIQETIRLSGGVLFSTYSPVSQGRLKEWKDKRTSERKKERESARKSERGRKIKGRRMYV